MRGSSKNTFNPSLVSDESAKRFRNQATGIGQCLGESERTGARRAQCVIDGAPAAQRKVADRSYPAPTPEYETLAGPSYWR